MPVNEDIPGFNGPDNLPTDDGETDCPDCREHEETIDALHGLVAELEAAGDAMANSRWAWDTGNPHDRRLRAAARAWRDLRAGKKRVAL